MQKHGSLLTVQILRIVAPALRWRALNSKAFRHEVGQPRDFKTMFAEISGRPVRLAMKTHTLQAGIAIVGLSSSF